MTDGRRRLGVQDALWLEMDKPGNLMVVDSLFWTREPIDWEAWTAVATERLWDRFPVFRSVVVRGEDGGWWWEERSDVRFEDRQERVVLAEPGGDAELQELIASRRTVPLDRDEPLWRAVLVDNYRGGSAVLFRAHHAIADGIRMVQLTLSVFDPGPEEAAPRPAASVPVASGANSPVDAAAPGGVATLAAGAVRTSARLARSAVTNPVGAAHSTVTVTQSVLGSAASRARSALGRRPDLPPVLAGVPGDLDTVRKLTLGTRNDTARWTGSVGQLKAIAWSPPIALDDVKAVARAHAATVNDVLVTCVAQSLHDYLRRHRTVCHSVTWDVPVNLVPFDPGLPVELGNSFALVQLELPTHLDDPLRTLGVVRRRMGRIKAGHEAAVDYGVQALISRMSTRVYRFTVDLLANRAIGVLTDVPGPQVPLYVAGRRIEGMMGWAPTTADQVMSFTIYSYDGKVFVGIAADAALVPDHEQVVDGFVDAFGRLESLTAGRSG
ncbi:hypothetical protein GCM10011376_29630 [Nocardioides flavus (ex Wang et al. 2016)]|uniref:diacylglycerol O-acyltransferase n=1 Tax=Nocardioides flavus (ex Wang et al. 2016) TaxID=2058780 RepID=A0ABQ3HL01_9ACTN|nr:hypothetical protein GCM10011376_29630 [Nocardioides flavus (ex Wang et al. 2016)]